MNHFPEIPGLDIALGLSYVVNNTTIYRGVLQKFVNNHAGFLNDFNAALARNDKETASHLIHTFKGVCHAIAAVQLAGKVEEAEDALRHDAADLTDKIAQVSAEQAQLICAIKAALDFK